MNNKKNLVIVMAAIPVAIALVIYMTTKVRFEIALTPDEKRIVNFTEKNISKVVERKTPVVITAIENPIQKSTAGERNFPGVPLAALAPPGSGTESAGLLPKPGEKANAVSFIMVNPSRKMAIIDGKLVNEGDMVGQKRVARIEEGRVLLQDRKGRTWLSLN